MPIKGVSSKEENILRNIIEPYREKYDFYLYGSRVKGNFRPLSDLDILIKSNTKINPEDIERLKVNFDESLLPYVVNITYDIDEKFYNLIKEDQVKV